MIDLLPGQRMSAPIRQQNVQRQMETDAEIKALRAEVRELTVKLNDLSNAVEGMTKRRTKKV